MHVYKKHFWFTTGLGLLSSGDKTTERDGEAQGMLGDYIFQLSLERHGKDSWEKEMRATPLTLLTPWPQSEQAIKEWMAGWTFKDLQITPFLKTRQE